MALTFDSLTILIMLLEQELCTMHHALCISSPYQQLSSTVRHDILKYPICKHVNLLFEVFMSVIAILCYPIMRGSDINKQSYAISQGNGTITTQ